MKQKVFFFLLFSLLGLGVLIVYKNNSDGYLAHRKKGEILLVQAQSGAAFYLPLVREAEKEFQEAVKRKDNDSDTHANLGIIAGIYGDYETAEKELKKALEINPKNTFALNNLGKTYWDQGKKEEAKSAWQKSLSLNSNQSKVREFLKKQ